jgi:holo-[acyl-carrier protein] synthase
MNNFGIGVDIESIERFVKLDRAKDSRFLAKIFTEKELDYCFKYKSPAEHLAVRYAGKEAVIKRWPVLIKRSWFTGISRY